MPDWAPVIELAVALGQIADDVANRSSELWFWRTVVYLDEKGKSKRKDGKRSETETPEQLGATISEDGEMIFGADEGGGDADEGRNNPTGNGSSVGPDP